MSTTNLQYHIDLFKLWLPRLWRNQISLLEDRPYVELYAATMAGNTAIVQILLEDGRADPTALYSATLRNAARNGHTDIVKLLLEDGRADPTAQDSYALQIAADEGHTAMVKLFLEDGRSDPAALYSSALCNGHTALYSSALCNGYTAIDQLLLSDHRIHDQDLSKLDFSIDRCIKQVYYFITEFNQEQESRVAQLSKELSVHMCSDLAYVTLTYLVVCPCFNKSHHSRTPL